jgi:putative addiction module component (TIGR02574 family)
MTDALQELYDKAAALPPEQRAELAELLLDTLDRAGDQEIADAWAGEIEQRLADYRAGRVTTVSWEEVRAHLQRPDR